jgi:glycosyltransferase involved in cell wall biosynthesis
MIQTIVYFVDSPLFGGTEQSLLHLLAGIDGQRWHPVLFHHAERGLAPLIEGAQRLNVATRLVPRMQGFQTVSGLPRFLQQLIVEHPNIFHAHLNWLLSCKYGLLASTLARVPAVIVTVQQFMYPPWGRTVHLQHRLIEKFVDRYIAVSEAVAKQLQQTFLIPPHKIRVIHNSIPVDRYDCEINLALKADLNLGSERPIVLMVARLDQQKGYPYLFEAISQMRDVILVIAGDGPEKASLEAQVNKLRLNDQVIFLGYRQDIPDLLACCDVFVLSSLYEGFPLSILEAMAAGKAVVATSVGGIPEAVLDGETGILVPPGDSLALARAIQEILSDPSLSQKMGAAGKARVKQEFSSITMVKRIAQIYEELLD